jgi:hypothetical protein
MLYQFNFGKSRWGGWRWRHIPVVYMPYWQSTKSTQDRVVYRPSSRTLGHLLGISGLALFLLAVVTWVVGFPWAPASDQGAQPKPVRSITAEEIQKVQQFTEKLKQNLSPEARAELQRKSATREKQRQQQVQRNQAVRHTSHRVMHILYWIMYGSLCAVMILPLAAYPFEWVTIQRDGDDLIVRKRGVWSVTRRWPLSDFGQIICYVDAQSQRSPNNASTIVGWRWMVKLAAPAETWIQEGPSLVDDPEVVFFIDYQKTQPANDAPAPGSVGKLVAHLQRLTGIKSVVRSEVWVDHSLFSGNRITQRYPMAAKPEITRHVAYSLDEIPVELRPAAEKIFQQSAEKKEPVVHQSFSATVRDSDGNTTVYNSLEEMPPQMRARYEEAMRQAKHNGPPP